MELRIPGPDESRMGPYIRLIDGDIKASEPVPAGELGYGIHVFTPIKMWFNGMNTSDPIFPEFQA